MYRLNFPSRLTEEEKVLKKKYTLLREKKEQLEKLNAEEEDTLDNFMKRKKPVKVDDSSSDDEREMENKPEDPKEVAKKLVKSGAIVLRKNEPTRTFKRAQALERKLSVAPAPPPPLKMRLKRVHDGSPKNSMDSGNFAEREGTSSRYVCQLPVQSQSRSRLSSMEAISSGPQPSSSLSSANQPSSSSWSANQPSSSSWSANQPSSSSWSSNQPSSSSSNRMKAGASFSDPTDWHKLVEANRQRMNASRRDFVDYKRRGLVSYKDVDGSSSDDD